MRRRESIFKKEKISSLLVVCFLLFGLALGLVACSPGNVEGPGEEEMQAEDYLFMDLLTDIFNVRDHPLYMSFSTLYEGELLPVELYIKEGSIRMDSQDEGAGKISIISSKAGDFIVFRDHGVYIVNNEAIDISDMAFFLAKDEAESLSIETGEGELRGDLYYYESLKGPEKTIIFYFQEGEWKAVKTQDKEGTQEIYINEIGRDVDDEIFSIPSTFIDMTGNF